MDNCKDNIEAISQLVDGELGDARASELRAHIAQCETCRRVYDAFSAISDSLGSDLARPPEMLSKGIMFKINLMTQRNKSSRFAFGRFTAIAACLAIILFGAGRFGLLGGKSARPAVRSEDSAEMQVLENSALTDVQTPEVGTQDFRISLNEGLFDVNLDDSQSAVPEEASLAGEGGSVTQFGLGANTYSNFGGQTIDETDFLFFLNGLLNNADKNTADDKDESYTVLPLETGNIPVSFALYEGLYKAPEDTVVNNFQKAEKPEPLAAFADLGSIRALSLILKDAAETEQRFSSEPTYTIGVFDESGKLMDEKISLLSLWVHEGKIYFKTAPEGKIMLSALKADEFSHFIEEQKTSK